MSIGQIEESLKALTKIHQALNELSKQKSNVLTKGDTDQLQKLLIEEQTLIQKLEQAERKRAKFVSEWFEEAGHGSEEATITGLLALIEDEEKQRRLEELAIDLTKSITELRESEQLNQALLQQSMHFIQTSLNIMQPTIESVNYDRHNEAKAKDKHGGRSMFDSRA